MTHIGTVEVFECDYCSAQMAVKSGLPSGWVWVKTGGPVKHACESCKERVPKEKQRKAGQIN